MAKQPCLYIHKGELQKTGKIFGFDLDCTLIGSIRVRGLNYLNPFISRHISNLYLNGYDIVIFTNQAKPPKDLEEKLTDFVKEFPIPVFLYACVKEKSQYRKPNTNMFDYFALQYSREIEEFCFCGDACTPEFNDDLNFEKNISDKYEFKTTFLNPAHYFSECREMVIDEIAKDKSIKIVVMYGFPASGKSTFAKKLIEEDDFIICSNDKTGSLKKTLALAKNSLENGKRVIIDNLNTTKANRKEILSLNEKTIAVIMNVGRLTAIERNEKRDKKVSSVVFNVFQGKCEPPSISEGFEKVISY